MIPFLLSSPKQIQHIAILFFWNPLTLLLKSGLAISRVNSQLYLKTALPMDLLGYRIGPSQPAL
jgi:hypothetical protein